MMDMKTAIAMDMRMGLKQTKEDRECKSQSSSVNRYGSFRN